MAKLKGGGGEWDPCTARRYGYSLFSEPDFFRAASQNVIFAVLYKEKLFLYYV
jgi:hypothetical protein